MSSGRGRFRWGVEFRIGIAVLAICGAALGCNGAEAKPKTDRSVNRAPVVLEKFVQLRAGMTMAEVHKLLGAGGEFGFSYLDEEGRVWLFEEHQIILASADQSHAEFMPSCCLLYQGGSLFALISPDTVDEFYKLRRERRPRRPREFREKDVDFEDDASILQWHLMKHEQGEEIPKAMERLRRSVLDADEQWKRERAKNQGDPGLGVVLSVASLFSRPINFERVAELNKVFDPFKVRIGMTEAEVSQLFEAPRFRKELGASRTVGLYGPKDPELPWSASATTGVTPILVLFEDGHAVRVLANGFVYHCWKSRIWPEYFGTCNDTK